MRSTGAFGARFTALLEGQTVGTCECVPDLTEGGALPALSGWGELTELEVAERWRNKGVGAWLIQHAIAWLRLGRCDRVVLAVAPESEAAGVDRFYQRCGWSPLSAKPRAGSGAPWPRGQEGQGRRKPAQRGKFRIGIPLGTPYGNRVGMPQTPLS